ncbi:hypothetical protein INT47_006686 [Mucor saturninus]|uniref:Phase-change related protein n=1 Tax=Mucor saturninus TaxID=64648 RepID=A0A8H7QTT4_9FUNG|nr:hypothetical protein INT47_006686 [Mucor saturninus]
MKTFSVITAFLLFAILQVWASPVSEAEEVVTQGFNEVTEAGHGGHGGGHGHGHGGHGHGHGGHGHGH